MDVRCNVCRHKETIPDRKVRSILEKNDGHIPCPSCGSHATTWDKDKLNVR